MKIRKIVAGKLKKYDNPANFEKDIEKYENLGNFDKQTEKV